MAAPRFHTKRSKRPTFGGEVAKFAESLGFPLMRWQRRALNVMLEHDRGGKWRAPSAAIAIPRQSGKSVLMLMVAGWWCLKWPDQIVVLVAPDRAGAARRLATLGQWLAATGHPTRYLGGAGQEKLRFTETGSVIYIVSSSRTGGHGDSVDAAFIDEAWGINPHTMQALAPAQVARGDVAAGGAGWFRLMISTAGDEDSEVWSTTVARGRDAVEDPDARFSYVEYSPRPGVDFLKTSNWSKFMPALGETIEIQDVIDASADLGGVGSGEWLRAFGNIATRSDDSLFKVDAIDSVFDGVVPIAPPVVVIGVDVSTGPDAATVAAAWRPDETEDQVFGVIVERRIGERSAWVVSAVEKVLMDHPGSPIAFSYGPALVVKDELENLATEFGVEAHDLNSTSTAGAAMRLFEHLRDHSISVLDVDDVLKSALLAARSKVQGDRWRFDRAVLVDQSPLIALAAAVDVSWVESLRSDGFLY